MYLFSLQLKPRICLPSYFVHLAERPLVLSLFPSLSVPFVPSLSILYLFHPSLTPLLFIVVVAFLFFIFRLVVFCVDGNVFFLSRFTFLAYASPGDAINPGYMNQHQWNTYIRDLSLPEGISPGGKREAVYRRIENIYLKLALKKQDGSFSFGQWVRGTEAIARLAFPEVYGKEGKGERRGGTIIPHTKQTNGADSAVAEFWER